MSHSWGKGARPPRWQWGGGPYARSHDYYNQHDRSWQGKRQQNSYWQPVLKEGPGGDGAGEDNADAPPATGPHAPLEAPQQQLRVANPPITQTGVGSGFSWPKEGDAEKGGKGCKGGSGKGGSRKGADAIELVQGRYTGIVRSVGTTQKGIDGLIEIDQDDKELEPRFIHYHSLNWLSASVKQTYEAYQQGWLVGHPVSFLVDVYENKKGPRGIALGMCLH